MQTHIHTHLPLYLLLFQQELLYNKHLHLDGTKLESLGFAYQKPELTIESMQEVGFQVMIYKMFVFKLLAFQHNLSNSLSVCLSLCALKLAQTEHYCYIFIYMRENQGTLKMF